MPIRYGLQYDRIYKRRTHPRVPRGTATDPFPVAKSAYREVRTGIFPRAATAARHLPDARPGTQGGLRRAIKKSSSPPLVLPLCTTRHGLPPRPEARSAGGIDRIPGVRGCDWRPTARKCSPAPIPATFQSGEYASRVPPFRLAGYPWQQSYILVFDPSGRRCRQRRETGLRCLQKPPRSPRVGRPLPAVLVSIAPHRKPSPAPLPPNRWAPAPPPLSSTRGDRRPPGPAAAAAQNLRFLRGQVRSPRSPAVRQIR